MRVPFRKPGKFSQMKPDPLMTQGKFQELEQQLARLKNSRPRAAAEVARLAEMGDFSENAAYQIAKGRLRGINQGITDIENQLKRAEIIKTDARSDKVQIGHVVTVETAGQQKTYQILGSTETDPQRGVISHTSPLGAALLGRRVGETFAVILASKAVEYYIVRVE